MKIGKKLWGKDEENGIFLYKLESKRVTVIVSNLGCIVQSICIDGRNVVLSYDTAEEYINDTYYIGCIIGRFAGRIANGEYTIDGIKYELTKNELPAGNHLHGGSRGLSKTIFEVKEKSSHGDNCFITFTTTSRDGDEGHPGELNISVTISLLSEGALSIRYQAETNKPTHLNLTHHHYFNLAGKGSATTQHAQILADHFLSADEAFIPDGNILPVESTGNNFLSPRKIKSHEDENCLNVYYQLNSKDIKSPAARLFSPDSGIQLEIKTTYPCIVFYSGDFLGGKFEKGEGVCMETQMFPDTPHHQHFPTTLLLPGTTYHHETRMLFKDIKFNA